MPRAQPEGHRERLALSTRERLDDLEARRAQLLERRIGELHLALDPDGAGDLKAPPRLDRILQQRGLADARLSVHHEDPAASLACPLEQPFQHLALTLAAQKLLARRPGDHLNARASSMALGRALRNSGIRPPGGGGTIPSMATTETSLPDYAPVPRSALGPALDGEEHYVGRVERNVYWVTDGTYQSAFLTTSDGVVLLDAPPTIGHNIRRAVDEIAAANGVSNKATTHLVYSHHHADQAGTSFLFDKDVVRIGHEVDARWRPPQGRNQ